MLYPIRARVYITRARPSNKMVHEDFIFLLETSVIHHSRDNSTYSSTRLSNETAHENFIFLLDTSPGAPTMSDAATRRNLLPPCPPLSLVARTAGSAATTHRPLSSSRPSATLLLYRQ